MRRQIEISEQEGWVGPILRAARSAQDGDVIVVHSAAQQDFLRRELAANGKSGVYTVNTRRRCRTANPFNAHDPGVNAAKLYDWIQHHAQAARQQI